MLSYTRLSGNARRFKALMGMSLQEFDLLLTKMERAHPEAERVRLSKRPRRRAIGAGAGSRWVCGIGRCCSCSTGGDKLQALGWEWKVGRLMAGW